MRSSFLLCLLSVGVVAAGGVAAGCSGDSSASDAGSGGTPASGGASSSGGSAPSAGGAQATGGSPTGGQSATGGEAATGGVPSGGAPAGGSNAGGMASGGAPAGGAPADGGSSGGGSGGGSSVSSCAVNGLLVCDGFESGTIDMSLWSVRTGGAGDVVEVTRDQAARGEFSVHISTQNGYGFLRNESAFPVPSNDYFGRMFIKVAEFSTVDWAHWTIAEAAGNGDGSLIRVGGQYNTNEQVNRWGVGSDGGPTGDWTNHDADPPGAVMEPLVGEWVCIEWEHKGSANETRFFVDGEEHPSLATSATDHGGSSADYVLPDFTSVWFGWYQYQSDDLTFDVWIDELAVGSERIGCD